MARKKIVLCKTVDELLNTYFPSLSLEEKAREKVSREAHASLVKANGQGKANIHLRARCSTRSLILFLDQTKDGKRTKETLKGLSLKIEDCEQTRLNNLNTLEVARKILNDRMNDILLTGVGISKKNRSKVKLVDYIQLLADEQLHKTNNKQSYYYVLNSLVKHLVIFKADKVTIGDVDIEFVKSFLYYLKNDALNLNFKRTGKEDRDEDKKLTASHQHHLWAKLNWVLNHCVYDGKMVSNPCNAIPRNEIPKEQKGTREFLTVEEIKALYKTECKQPQVKQAFLFSCLVGLRFSDIVQLQWKHFSKDFEGEVKLKKVMQKLSHLDGNAKILDTYVSAEALKWVPRKENAKDDDYVYDKLSDNEQTNIWLKQWVSQAGITKKITFHCSRHTAATLNLSLGVEPIKVMKMMGHSKLATTEIYMKVLEESLKGETSKQNGIFD